jgi:hypothetical protein
LYIYCLTTGWTTGVLSPAEARDFSSSFRVQTSSEVHPTSYPIGTGGPFPGIKLGRGMTLTTPPSIAEVKNYYELKILSPRCLHSGSGTALLYII